MSEPALRVLVLCLHGEEEASMRYRIAAFLPALRAQGIAVEVAPFFSGTGGRARRFLRGWWRRLTLLLRRGEFDVLWVHRFAVPRFGNQVVGWFGLPMVYDFDDAIWFRTAQGTRRTREWNTLVRLATVVCAGNRYLQQESQEAGAANAVLLPTVVDVEKFTPSENRTSIPVVGWMGSPATFPYLRAWLPALDALAQSTQFILRIIGAGVPVSLPHAQVEQPLWSADTEARQVAAFTVGLYPLADDPWVRGKCALKAIQYMACGVPFVVSPVGATADITTHGKEALWASSVEEMRDAVLQLLQDATLRHNLGRAGRARSEKHFGLTETVPQLIGILRSAKSLRPNRAS